MLLVDIYQKNETTLLLDISEFENYKLHKYCLFKFKIKEKFFNKDDFKIIENKINISLVAIFIAINIFKIHKGEEFII